MKSMGTLCFILYISRQDLDYMCEQLGLEECVEDIMTQIGVDCDGLISFEEFALCRQRLMNEIEQEKMRTNLPMPDSRAAGVELNLGKGAQMALKYFLWP